MNESTRELFRTLTEFPAAPGFEKRAARLGKNALSPYTEEFVQDRLGSLFAVLRGNDEGPRVMVAGHMDEVGFMVTGITEAGMVRFQPLGGWWSQAVLAQRLQIITDNGPIIGVVGSIPTHLLDEAQRSKPVDIKSMYIDIGADNKAEAESFGIRLGQQIVPICEFTPLANPKKSWLRHGITDTASAWPSSSFKLFTERSFRIRFMPEPPFKKSSDFAARGLQPT